MYRKECDSDAYAVRARQDDAIPGAYAERPQARSTTSHPFDERSVRQLDGVVGDREPPRASRCVSDYLGVQRRVLGYRLHERSDARRARERRRSCPGSNDTRYSRRGSPGRSRNMDASMLARETAKNAKVLGANGEVISRLDSMDVANLVVSLEKATGRKVPPSEMRIENFQSVAALAALIARMPWMRGRLRQERAVRDAGY